MIDAAERAYRRTKYVWMGYGERHVYFTLGRAKRERDKWSAKTRCGTSIHQISYVPGEGWVSLELRAV